jgi:AAA domain/REase_MTES_1575
MHRAPQVIVVGDQMQLPPTQYFQVAPRVDPELGADLDLDPDDAEQIGVVLTEDSFLSVSALRLASTMLSWHYRSRSEALISFSNSAFYGGRLATIPDRVPPGRADAWTVLSAGTAAGTAARGGSGTASGGGDGLAEVTGALLAGSITAVRVLDGVYSRRTNPAEASWIAHLVRELLGRETGDSIGIVAFSEAQQGEIERALERLAQEDPVFGDRYEAELSRTVDGQDVSLFVKNLENVQGDERDIVIMSICYAPGPDGRMLMTFGPINTAGGEKRLNVIFSRARKHMVVVSSIAPDAITNTYNDGANTLRRFLAYAEAVSRGDTEAARAALAPYAAARPRRTPLAAHLPPALAPTHVPDVPTTQAAVTVVGQLAEALQRRGVEVWPDIGESAFRCDLALRRPGDRGYSVAVLVDTPARIASASTLERLSTHHRALAGAGWVVSDVLTSDWLRDPDSVTDRLIEVLDRTSPA